MPRNLKAVFQLIPRGLAPRLFTVCLISSLFLNGQENFETGKIIDSIAITGNPDENFALYLPKSFNPDVLSPILFIFDPVARGKIGIEAFKQVSETYGHILVCSNSIKNGPYDKNLQITQRWFDHVFKKFNINENQIYLTGFSGGSRLATAIACLTNQPAGVIACGAGFAGVPDYTPRTQNFSYVGICGNRDMNFTEMIKAKHYLDELNFNNTLFVFDGDHRWPPSKSMLQAFDWLAIQAHQKGKVKKSKDEVQNSYTNSWAAAEKDKAEKKFIRAAEGYERILSTYTEFYSLDSIATKLNELKLQKTYRNAVKKRKEAFEKEDDRTKILVTRFNTEYLKPEKFNLKWWKKQLGSIDKDEKSESLELKLMKNRLRFKIFAMAYERMKLSAAVSNKQRDFCKKICGLIYPNFKE